MSEEGRRGREGGGRRREGGVNNYKFLCTKVGATNFI
jgi:hypothetical protein